MNIRAKIPRFPRTGARKKPVFLGYGRCGYCRAAFMRWSDQHASEFCSNICELSNERFSALEYWRKKVSNEADLVNGKDVPPLQESSREAE